jgi:hypothetical protein
MQEGARALVHARHDSRGHYSTSFATFGNRRVFQRRQPRLIDLILGGWIKAVSKLSAVRTIYYSRAQPAKSIGIKKSPSKSSPLRSFTGNDTEGLHNYY